MEMMNSHLLDMKINRKVNTDLSFTYSMKSSRASSLLTPKIYSKNKFISS